MTQENSNLRKVWPCVGLAAILWFVMFSPYTSGRLNFWLVMSISGLTLSSLATIFCKEWLKEVHFSFKGLALGVAIAAFLWGVFWIGDKVSQWMFGFAGEQIGSIYDMKTGTSPTLIACLLFFIIGPAEEIFWRIFVQRRFSEKWGANIGWIAATAIYTLIHIWSFNFILIMAALIAGGIWGLIYRLNPKALFPLILSHALWDAAVFIIFPI